MTQLKTEPVNLNVNYIVHTYIRTYIKYIRTYIKYIRTYMHTYITYIHTQTYIHIHTYIMHTYIIHSYTHIHTYSGPSKVEWFETRIKIRKSNNERGIAQHRATHATVSQQIRTRLVECCWSVCASARPVLP
jgi:hypothetical protein